MSDKKVINFPTTKDPDGSIEQKAEDGHNTVLQIIDRNRKAGLEKLERAVDNFENRPMISGENAETFNEGMLRDLEAGLTAVYTVLESVNNLVEMIRHDLVGLIQNQEQMSVANWQTSAHLQVLLTLLKEKGVILEEEMRDTWNKLVPAQMEKAKEEIEETQTTSESE